MVDIVVDASAMVDALAGTALRAGRDRPPPAPRGRGDRPTDPWKPGRLQVHGITRRTQKVWETDGRTGDKVRRARPRFDVRFRVDGFEFRYSFPQKGWADAYASGLQEGQVKGCCSTPRPASTSTPPPSPTATPSRS